MTSIVLDNVSQRLPLHGAEARSLRRAIARTAVGGRFEKGASGAMEIAALSDISLCIADGERVGLVGLNGAGKSTLLRVLAGIYQPTRGRVSVSGRVVPLMDTFMGIVSDSTGRENIRNRGYLLGMTPREVDQKSEEIIAFSELGAFIDLPVRTYSAGMYTRLAFAISTAVECDILLVDEGIGAGDARFLEKAGRRIEEIFRRAGILVLASHSEEIIRRTCNRVILLDHGSVRYDGPTDPAFENYHRLLGEPSEELVQG